MTPAPRGDDGTTESRRRGALAERLEATVSRGFSKAATLLTMYCVVQHQLGAGESVPAGLRKVLLKMNAQVCRMFQRLRQLVARPLQKAASKEEAVARSLLDSEALRRMPDLRAHELEVRQSGSVNGPQLCTDIVLGR